MKQKTGILLINLGTPDSPRKADVKRYLKEFLLDPRVIDYPPLKRNLLVRGIIIPFRVNNTTRIYKEVWTEEGSPLLFYSERLLEKLQNKLGKQYEVALAMRYQNPSIAEALNQLKRAKVSRIIVFPLFPQYASASTGTAHERVMEIVKEWNVIPEIKFINSYFDHPKMIKIFADNGRKHGIENYDHILFSYHGLPERHIHKAAVNNYCQLNNKCCSNLNLNNQFCYRAQCYQTTLALAKELGLSDDQWSFCFQSRLGKEPWVKPYTDKVIEQLAEEGKKKVLVFCPAFVADCLETIYEISVEYAEEFKKMGGEDLQLVESLNDNDAWVEAIAGMVTAN